MESIDRLREWANGLHGVYINQVDHTITVTTGWDTPPDMDSVSLRDHINGILDGIEREVDEARDRDYHNGVEDGEMAAERVIRCRNCRELDQNDIDWRDWCFCRNFREYVEPNGYCAWGIDKED